VDPIESYLRNSTATLRRVYKELLKNHLSDAMLDVERVKRREER